MKHENWVHDWKFLMGLDGARKIVFRPTIPVRDIADQVEILARALEQGKNLHAFCRVAPRITQQDYESILAVAHVTSYGYPLRAHIMRAIEEIGKVKIKKNELLDRVEQIMNEEEKKLKKDWREKTWQNIQKWALEVTE